MESMAGCKGLKHSTEQVNSTQVISFSYEYKTDDNSNLPPLLDPPSHLEGGHPSFWIFWKSSFSFPCPQFCPEIPS